MFKIGRVPSLQAGPIEHADFLELECLRQSDRNASGGDLAAALGRVDDDLPEERDESDIHTENYVRETFEELEYRSEHCGIGPHPYPFKVYGDSLFLEFTGSRNNWGLYIFLLFATRMNMRDDKVQGGIDGTALFEEICCEVAKAYWGNRSGGMVFGTARRNGDDEVGAFSTAVTAMCGHLGECGNYH